MHDYMRDIYEVKEKVLEELATYKAAEKIDPSIAGQIKTLASAADHLCNVVEGMEQGGSSSRGMSGRGMYDGRYNGMFGGSYEGGSYDDGYSGRRGRDSMGRYTSRDDGMSREGMSRDDGDYYERLERMIQQAPNENDKRAMQDMLHRIRR